jgi:hypothetical protein
MYTMLSLRDFFLNYQTINIKIDIYILNHRIINQIVKSPLSHSLTTEPVGPWDTGQESDCYIMRFCLWDRGTKDS